MSERPPDIAGYRLSSRSMWILAILVFAVTRISNFPLSLDFRVDEVLYFNWALLIREGGFPVGDDQYQYPPAAGVLFLGIELLPGTFHRVFMFSVVLADAAIFILMLVRVGRFGDSWRGPWIWITAGALVGYFMFERFDVFPALLAVIALLVLSRPTISGGLMGLGAMIKLWPIFVLFAVRRDQLIRALAGVLVGVFGVIGIVALTLDNPLSFLSGQSGRGLQLEANVAFPLLIAAQLGLVKVQSVDRYGSTELDAPYAGGIAWLGIAIAVALLAMLVIQRLRGKLEMIPGSDVALAALLVFIAFNRVNSPQFFTWIAAVASVALLDRRSRMVVPVVLVFASMLPFAQYISHYYWALQVQTTEAVILQVIRSALMIAGAVLAWWFVVNGRAYRDVSSANTRI